VQELELLVTKAMTEACIMKDLFVGDFALVLARKIWLMERNKAQWTAFCNLLLMMV
jgi:hypothetical protein